MKTNDASKAFEAYFYRQMLSQTGVGKSAFGGGGAAGATFADMFTEALAEEVTGSAVRVSCLAPGPTETEFAEVAGLKKSPLFTGAVMAAEPVARAGYEGWKRGKVLVIPGASNRLGAIAVRLARPGAG